MAVVAWWCFCRYELEEHPGVCRALEHTAEALIFNSEGEGEGEADKGQADKESEGSGAAVEVSTSGPGGRAGGAAGAWAGEA